MSSELQNHAIEAVRLGLPAGSVREPLVVACSEETGWQPARLRTISEHELVVLGRVADMVVFFDEAGQMRGWRDDGCLGAPSPGCVDRRAFLQSMVTQLDLPAETQLGKLEPVELPPVGWTHEAVLFLRDLPRPQDVLHVWVEPRRLRVIQCWQGLLPA